MKGNPKKEDGEKNPLLGNPSPNYHDTDSLPNTFIGHYKDYDVPYYFQRLIMSLYNLRQACKSEKYQVHFDEINKVLKEFFNIIKDNKLNEGTEKTSGMDLQYATNSELLEKNVKYIIEKRKNKDEKFTEYIGIFTVNKSTLVEKLLYAFNAVKSPGKCPAPEHPNNSLSPKELLQLIDNIKAEPKPPLWWHFIPHAYTYARKTMIVGTTFFIAACSATSQSTFDFFMTDNHLNAENRSPSYVHYAIPLALGFIGLAIMTEGVIYSRRKQFSRQILQWWQARRTPKSAENAVPLSEVKVLKSSALLENISNAFKRLKIKKSPTFQPDLATLQAYLINPGRDFTLANQIEEYLKNNGHSTSYFSFK